MLQVDTTSWPKHRGRTWGAVTGSDPREGVMQISVMSQVLSKVLLATALLGSQGGEEKDGLDQPHFPPTLIELGVEDQKPQLPFLELF